MSDTRIIKSLESIAKSLDRIANSMDNKQEIAFTDSANKIRLAEEGGPGAAVTRRWE